MKDWTDVFYSAVAMIGIIIMVVVIAVELHARSLRKNAGSTSDRLDRIETKLDRLLEERER
jgi:hypothetical protein